MTVFLVWYDGPTGRRKELKGVFAKQEDAQAYVHARYAYRIEEVEVR